MREFLDENYLYNNIRLHLQSAGSRVLLVEGADDCKMLKEAVERVGLVLLPGYGKPKCLATARRLLRDNVTDVKVFLDADFDRLTGEAEEYPENVFLTEMYDLTVDAHKAAPHLLSRMAHFNGHSERRLLTDGELVDLVVEVSSKVGLVRYASELYGWGLRLTKFPFAAILDNHSARSLSLESIAEMGIGRTSDCELDPFDVSSAAASLDKDQDFRFRLINGHDLLRAFETLASKYIGHKSSTACESQFSMLAAGEISKLPSLAPIFEWALAA